MARYLPLFALQVSHEFFSDAGSLPLQIQASKACAKEMERQGLLLRVVNNGIEVWNEVREFDEVDARMSFEFLVSSKDPYLDSYTAWECAKPLSYRSPGSGGLQENLVATSVEEQDFGLSAIEKQRMGLVFSVQLEHGLHAEVDQDMKQYQIQLQSKTMHWKYYFSGALAKKKLEIVDLDAANTESGCRFIPSSKIVTEDSLAFVSEAQLPMRSIPTQRFQLREEGANGRVLMRRLPNASIDKIGKEKGPDGQSLVVAEIYIHQ